MGNFVLPPKCDTEPFICPACCLCASSSFFLPFPALYMSAIRQIVTGLICIVSLTIPTGAPCSCLLKDSGATAPSYSPIPWIKLTLGQHQHIMNYGHLPPQTHCSFCSSVRNIERTAGPGVLTAYSLIFSAVCVSGKWTKRTALQCECVDPPEGRDYLSYSLTLFQNYNIITNLSLQVI